MITCQACGTQNPAGSQYCSKCARKLDEKTQQRIVAQREAHSAMGVRWSAVILALLVLIIVIAVMVGLLVGGVI
jgi:uncharacterized membrane protein YvbJ